MDHKINRKERVFFLIGLVPVFWLCFKVTGKVTQEQINIFTTDAVGSLIEISPLFIFYCGITSTVVYMILYICLYITQQDNLHLLRLPLNEWEDRMYHMVILSASLTVLFSSFFSIVAVFVIERNFIYKCLILFTTGAVVIGYLFKIRPNLSEVKLRSIGKSLCSYLTVFFISFCFVVTVMSPIPQLTVETKFYPNGLIDIHTISDEKIKNVLVQIYSDNGEHKVAERRQNSFSTSGFYKVNQNNYRSEVKQKQESRTYKINIENLGCKLIPTKKYYANIIFEFENRKYLLENEFSIKNNEYCFKDNKMKYKYTD